MDALLDGILLARLAHCAQRNDMKNFRPRAQANAYTLAHARPHSAHAFTTTTTCPPPDADDWFDALPASPAPATTSTAPPTNTYHARGGADPTPVAAATLDLQRAIHAIAPAHTPNPMPSAF